MRLLRETWSEVSYSSENAAVELATNLGQYGEILELGRLVDVDQAEDLTALRDEFMALTRPTAEQAAVISWIEQESCISSNGAPDSP
jgi:hypothetical protein